MVCYNTPCVRRKVAHPRLGCRQAVRHQTLTLAFVGSNPAIPATLISYGSLAQLVEQRPFKAWVQGSSPWRATKKADTLKGICFFDCSRGLENLNPTALWAVGRWVGPHRYLTIYFPQEINWQRVPGELPARRAENIAGLEKEKQRSQRHQRLKIAVRISLTLLSIPV